ncbi:MAG: hypothetical protein IPL53_22105 [Ignavibacteria bacterium]|nr:hypothetical protein [Ignavibacteria bacterium]
MDTETRIRNADHNASFAIALANIADLSPIAKHRAGFDLGIGLLGSSSSIKATGFVQALIITGNEDLQVGIKIQNGK